MPVKVLHQIYPALHYVAGGSLAPVALTRINGNGKIVPNEITSVLITHTESPNLSIAEVDNYATGVLPVTKIYNPDNGDGVYVAEYIDDVLPWVHCCPNDEALTPAFSFQSTTGKLNVTFSETASFIIESSNGVQNFISDGLTVDIGSVLTDTTKVYITSDPTKLIAINFNPTLEINKNVQNISNLSALSGLLVFTCERTNLAALPLLPSTLHTLSVWDNDLTTVVLPASLTGLDVRNNQLTTLPTIPAAVSSVEAENNQLTVTAVSNILIQLNANGVHNGQCHLEGQTPPATPNSGGNTAKTALLGNGWTITND